MGDALEDYVRMAARKSVSWTALKNELDSLRMKPRDEWGNDEFKEGEDHVVHVQVGFPHVLRVWMVNGGTLGLRGRVVPGWKRWGAFVEYYSKLQLWMRYKTIEKDPLHSSAEGRLCDEMMRTLNEKWDGLDAVYESESVKVQKRLNL